MHYRIKSSSKVIFGLLLSTALAGSAFAQDASRVDQLEKRVGGIETKLDALIELMTKDKAPVNGGASEKAGTTEEVSSGEQTAAVPSSFQPGLVLDLYTVPMVDSYQLPEAPDGIVVASEFVPGHSTFNWGEFTALPSMERFSAPINKEIALHWSGFINIPVAGKTVFQMELSGKLQHLTKACVMAFRLDDTLVAEINSKGHDAGDSLSTVEQGSAELATGFHRFSLWGICKKFDREMPFDKINFALMSKGPNDRAPKPIADSAFFREG